ncbi:hypothetical protein GCM10010193_61980 [Kitasatospora atroaurantiaca]
MGPSAPEWERWPPRLLKDMSRVEVRLTVRAQYGLYQRRGAGWCPGKIYG